jgi:hypothetical protein
MKKISLVLLCSVLIVGLSSTNSCKKDNKIKGCTDKDSKTYSSTAEEDDGSCLYEGYIVFWYSQAASAGLIADGATALTFYLNDQLVGSSAASVYWTTAPDCGQNGSITVTEDLENVKNHLYSLSVKDQTGFEYWTGTVSVDGNTCSQYQLLWSSRKKK